MAGKRYLIVNADDFGLSRGVNRGIVKAYENGIVTSASLMVRHSAALQAAEFARKNPGISLGLHFDFGEWIYRNGGWISIYEVVSVENAKALEDEAFEQLSAFRRIIGDDPTHMDSHQHVHLQEPVRKVLQKIARNLDIPLRHFHGPIRYCGDFYGQTREGNPLPKNAVSVEKLVIILENLQQGITELACHPGNGEDIITAYGKERVEEMKTLCDPRVRSAIKNLDIQLCSFHDWKKIKSEISRWCQ